MFALKAFRALFHTGSFDFSNMRLRETFNIETREKLKISGVKFAKPVRAIAESNNPVFSGQRIGLVSQMASGKTKWSRSFLSTLLDCGEQDCDHKGVTVSEHAALDDDQNFGYVWSFEEAATAKLYLAPELEGRAEIEEYVSDMRSLGF